VARLGKSGPEAAQRVPEQIMKGLGKGNCTILWGSEQ